MVELVVAVKCPCGHPGCSKWGLNLGTFYQGCGWDEDTAKRFAAAYNACKGIPTETLEGGGEGWLYPMAVDFVSEQATASENVKRMYESAVTQQATAEEAMRLLGELDKAEHAGDAACVLGAYRAVRRKACAFLEAHDG